MATFNVSVQLDWLDEEENLDERLKDEIISGIVSKVSVNATASIEAEAKTLLNERMKSLELEIGEKLNTMMEDFFDSPKDITDQWGDVTERGVTVRKKLKEACAHYLDQPLDRDGKPTSQGYSKYKTRLDYIIEKSVDHDMEWAIKKAVSEVTDGLKKKIAGEVKTQIGEKLADIIGLDKIAGLNM